MSRKIPIRTLAQDNQPASPAFAYILRDIACQHVDGVRYSHGSFIWHIATPNGRQYKAHTEERE